MASKWPLHSPHRPFSPDILAWIDSSHLGYSQIKLSLPNTVVETLKIVHIAKLILWHHVDSSTNLDVQWWAKLTCVCTLVCISAHGCICTGQAHWSVHQLHAGPADAINVGKIHQGCHCRPPKRCHGDLHLGTLSSQSLYVEKSLGS